MNNELSDAIEAGVLTPCSESNEWVHQIFPVPKPGRPEVRLLLTVISTQGRFRYNSLSQGICSASDFFNFLSDGNIGGKLVGAG